MERTVTIPEGGSLYLQCRGAGRLRVANATWGAGACRVDAPPLLDHCRDRRQCCIPVNTANLGDPCPGAAKQLRARVSGCVLRARETTQKRRCKLSGHSLGAADVAYLSTASFPAQRSGSAVPEHPLSITRVSRSAGAE